MMEPRTKRRPNYLYMYSTGGVYGKHQLFSPRGETHPSVVMVTMVYQKEAGMLVNLLELEPFSA